MADVLSGRVWQREWAHLGGVWSLCSVFGGAGFASGGADRRLNI